MIKIGILGDIGSGKTHISKQFGYPVFQADLEVKKIYEKNKICFKKLNKKIPKYIKSFPIKKNELTNAILRNKKNLVKIIKVVHPMVREKMYRFFKKNKKKKFVILDIPLLLENRINNKNYILVFVDANKKVIQGKLKKRKNYNAKIIRELKKFQLPLELKKKKANFIIKNNFKNITAKKNVNVLKKIILKYVGNNP